MAKGQPQAARDYRRIAEVVLLALGALGFTALARYHFRHVCDDAFIVFRYADNLVAGVGPVWNPREAVEGFSSPLWLALVALGGWLGAAPPAWAAGWGVGFSLASLVVAHRLALALSGSRVAAAATAAAGSLLYPLAYWAPAGLETAMFTVLLTAAAWSLAGARPARWALAGAALGVARPEGPLLVLALGALAWWVHGPAARRPRALLLACGPAVAWQLFRLAYYDAWLPNTYHAKATGALLPRLMAGLVYAGWGLAALGVAVAAVWGAGGARRRSVAVLALAAMELAVVVGGGGDWMWHGRMLLPVLPALLALGASAVATAPGRRRAVLALAGALAWSGFLPSQHVAGAALAGGSLPAVAHQEGSLVAASRDVAAFVAEHYPAAALIAVNHAGALPYALPNRVLDMTGLCDRHIARKVTGGLHGKYDPDYVLAREPRLVVLNSRIRPGTAGQWYHPGYWAGETALVAHPEFAARYRPVPRFWSWRWRGAGGGGHVLVYERAVPAAPVTP